MILFLFLLYRFCFYCIGFFVIVVWFCRGTEEFFGLGTDRVDIINSTLGKVGEGMYYYA